LSQRNRTEEAAYNFERAIRSRPNYALAHLNYGLLLRNLGRVDEAKQHARLAAGSSDGPTREAAGRLLIELGSY
jgi:tetratricopeptide (TPR) repeat protein